MAARAWTAKTSTVGVCAAGVLALALAGCAGSDEPPGDTGTNVTQPPTSTATDDTSPTPSPGESPAETNGTDDTGDEPSADVPFVDPSTIEQAEPSADAFLTVTDVRVARHDTFDRVVFDLEGAGTPGWRVEYVDEALDDGSGFPVDVEGDAVIQVRIAGTGMPTETGVEEFTGGPVVLDGDGVEEAVYRFWFEGYSTAFVGTDDRTPFRVFTLSSPTRLVIDIEHDG